MKRPKADWVASLIAVTLLIFAAGAALDRSRLVRAASISSNLGRTTTATSLGTNLGRRHLELDVLVGVVTGTHGDGGRPQPGATPPTGTGAEGSLPLGPHALYVRRTRIPASGVPYVPRAVAPQVLVGVVTGTRGDGRRPQPGATNTDADTTPILNLARTLTPAQPRTGVAAPAPAPLQLQLQHQAEARQLQHQAGAGAGARRSPSFLLQQEQEKQIALLKARLDALQLAPVPGTATQPRAGVVPLLESVTPRPGATPDTGTTGVNTGTTGVAPVSEVAPGRGVTDPNLAMISIPPADLGATSPAISPHLATSPPEVCVVNHLGYSELNPSPSYPNLNLTLALSLTL
eukprot:scaffold29735_cov66-Phaeocystis_antarctica.AAC.4